MFVQVLQGRVTDTEAARATMDRWLTELEPGAVGWLGGTFGFTDDHQLIAVVRFVSREDAARNSERPEQAAWWDEMSKHFDGEVTFHDCGDVTLLAHGGADDAGFVQVIQGRVKDVDRAHTLLDRAGGLIAQHRPDVIGATIAIDDTGWMTETVFFTSESDARLAENREMPAELQQLADDEMRLLDDVQFLDLHTPWFATSRRTT
jgi:hypothetical protein